METFNFGPGQGWMIKDLDMRLQIFEEEFHFRIKNKSLNSNNRIAIFL
jgi:hypothetical protein